MKSKSIALAFLPLWTAGAIVVACSSSSTPSSASTAPTSGVDAAACMGVCCAAPSPGTSCSDPTATCSNAITCAEGLVVSRTLACQSGAWQTVNDCPLPGAVDITGCPGAQPTTGTPCAAADGGIFPTCTYAKDCGTKFCNDAGVCSQVVSSAQATCVNGAWKTTPLGC